MEGGALYALRTRTQPVFPLLGALEQRRGAGGGSAGYERVRRSDEQGIAPGAETLRELFGVEPTLILLDELAVYLRKVWRQQGAAQQLTAFLTSLFKAVEGAPNAALVYTLAVGGDGRATDAYSEENQFVADAMAELMSVSARKPTLLNPTQDAETAPVLLRRLFERVDDGKARTIDAYQTLWREHRESLAEEAARPQTAQDFAASYPFHPDVLATLRGKTSTLSEFQRVRGMLRLLARTIAHLWQERPVDATAIHLHHVDLGQEPIRQELVTRLGQSAFVPAIANDIASGSGGGGGESGESHSLAESIDAAHYRGLPPYAAYAARTAFLHTLAFNEPLKGLAPEQLRYAMLAPTLDISFVEEARKRFVAESAYLDDRPALPCAFWRKPTSTRSSAARSATWIPAKPMLIGATRSSAASALAWSAATTSTSAATCCLGRATRRHRCRSTSRRWC